METSKIFVGRARELSELEAGLTAAIDGRGRLFLIAGEPGIGKTRLADELAERAAARGVRVLWGRCWEGDGAPANWPWIQILRALAGTTDAAVFHSQLGAGAPYVSQLIPELQPSDPADAPTPAVAPEPERARFYLFDAVATLLKRAAEREPLLLILDDFHAADLPSLRLLQFLGRELREARILVVVTYRDVEMNARATGGEIPADLARDGRKMHLKGLSEPDVARLIETTAGAVASTRLVSALHRTTEGNPFFVEETMHHLVESGAMVEREGRLTTDRTLDELGLPEGVKEVVGRRLARLSEECNRVLTLAAVIGREFGLDVLGPVSHLGAVRVLEAVEEALATRIIREVPHAAGRYTFSHAVVRETLYGALTIARRVPLHRQIGEVLEGLYAARPEPHLAELAYHFHEAAPGGDVPKAIDYARRAAEHATASLAYEEAARLYGLALQALDRQASGDERRRCEFLLARGEAETRAGDLELATETFRAAARVARELGASEQLARAAVGCGGRFVWGAGASDDCLIALLEESLGALGEGDSALRVRVMARLATALYGRVIYWRGSLERGALLSRQAVEMARRLDDTVSLAYALEARYVAAWGPDGVEERLAIATEMLRLAEEVGDRERAHQGHHWRMFALLELGDIQAVDVEIAAQARLAEELRQPAQLWHTGVVRAMRALLAGRFEQGEQLAQQALALGQTRYPARLVILAAQRFVARRHQGRLHEVEAAWKKNVERYPGAAFPRATLALLHGELGHETDARREFEHAAASDFADFPRDHLWISIVSWFSEVCAFLRDARRARTLYEMLLPYADRNVANPAYVCYGSASRSLGILATTMYRWEEAERHFEHALAMNTRMSARPWVAHTQQDYAAMLLARGAPGDRERALALLTEAGETARQLGMKSLLDKAETLQRRGVATPAESQPRNIFRRDGDCWAIVHHGRSFAVRDMKGLQCIARLLRQPGRQIHCLELVADDEGPSVEDRRRLKELETDLEEARNRNDLGQAMRVQAEMEPLVSRLASAIGLGVQDAESMRARERARVNVTRTIKDAIARIREHDASLARHLAHAIRTGTLCSYAPEPGAEVPWSL